MAKEIIYYVYLLRCKDDSLYTGITVNVADRMKAHESGKGSKYVFSRRPFKLVYAERVIGKSAALKREAEIKKMSKKKKEKFILR